MNDKKKMMSQVKGGVLAQADIDLLKKTIEFYLKNNSTTKL